jgi:hypothetical protein
MISAKSGAEMGGMGSGRLTPGCAFGWQWSRNGKTVASIQVRAEGERVILTYRHRSGGSDWNVGAVWVQERPFPQRKRLDRT